MRWPLPQATDGEDQVVYRSGARHVPRLQRRSTAAASPVELSPDTSQLSSGPPAISDRISSDSSRGWEPKRSSRWPEIPGSLQQLTQSLAASTGTNLVTVAADATDAAAMSALFDRFGTDLPPLEGIYLAAFAGGPVLLSEMTDDDVAGDVLVPS